MRYSLSRNQTPTAGKFELTKADIESQAMADFRRYGIAYRKKFGCASSDPVDVDNFVEELWGVTVEYESIAQPNADEVVLGFFDPSAKRIVVDGDRCGNPSRISFTVAHEAGHLSLHSFLSLKAGDATPKQGERLPRINDPT